MAQGPAQRSEPGGKFSSFRFPVIPVFRSLMHIHWLQHVEFEGLGCIDSWLRAGSHTVSCTRLWAGDGLPRPQDTGGLIVMGGPMGVYDEDSYPWLAAEKTWIREVIEQNKPVLGICLGAQLIADVLGARVRKNDCREIGFYELTGDGVLFPDRFCAFHWHGDTFDIPDGAVHLASSEATANQAFRYQDNVFALQFHLETTRESLMALYQHGLQEVVEGPFIQRLEEMEPFFPALGKANERMFHLLNRLF